MISTGAGGAASGSMPRMRHQRRASLVMALMSPSGVRWTSRQVARSRVRRCGPMTASTLAVTVLVSPGSRIPASSRASRRAAARPASRGVPGSAPAAVKSARMRPVAHGSQPAAVAGAAAGLACLDAGLFQLAGGGAPVGPLRHREALAGVGGVGALVDQGSPGDRVALAVGGAGGVAVVGVCSEELAVDLDDRDAGDVAGGVAEAGPGGAGDRDRAAGDRGDLGGHGVGELLPGAGRGGEPGGGGEGGGGHRGRSFPVAAGGLDLAAEGEGDDRLAGEGPGYGVGYYVAVLLGGDADQVGDGGGLAEDAGDLGVGEELAELG